MDAYCDTLASYLTEQCSWLQSAGDYPEKTDPLATPCAFINIDGWDVPDDGEHNGQTSVSLDVQILVVIGLESEVYQRTVRNAAAAVTSVISDSLLNMNFRPAQFTSAQPYAFDPELDEYAVWEVRYKHTVDFGQSLFAFDGITPTTVLVGLSPDIGSGHQDDYQQVIPEPSDE
ncbi:hypothetical protein [Celerinatantimonas sp. MCCC 1A17872]|uniref:hypothetical protein n=1 Tax=Celerinatantimonas sp. MCCC 1A17872 TaxID=3177514 RepID=UPI0038BE69CE